MCFDNIMYCVKCILKLFAMHTNSMLDTFAIIYVVVIVIIIVVIIIISKIIIIITIVIAAINRGDCQNNKLVLYSHTPHMHALISR